LKRRTFLKFAALAAVLNPIETLAVVSDGRFAKIEKRSPQLNVHPLTFPENSIEVGKDQDIKDYLTKIRHPDSSHKDDIILEREQLQLLLSVVERLKKIQITIGHGNFSVLGFGDALLVGRQYPKIGRFTQPELDFLEMIYYRDARDYGFKGKKLIATLSQNTRKKDVSKVPYMGQYLFKGESLAKFEEVKRDLGEDLVLTSGIRGITKQFYLFLNKACRHGGNLSLASRSLAPPGYSYHATGDFDVGQKGFGGGNFSEEFTTTPVFKRLARRGLVDYRYRRDNMLGVRYEPWHIKL
jgi:D-alanyl-D-alanine carboxypeptidase